MFKYKIIELDQIIKIDPQKFYIAFKVNNTNIVDIEIQKNSIKLWINLKFGSLQDPRALAKDMRNIGHRGNGDYELSISDDKNFAYIYGLIEQSYKDKIYVMQSNEIRQRYLKFFEKGTYYNSFCFFGSRK
jgi:predicted transport protein